MKKEGIGVYASARIVLIFYLLLFSLLIVFFLGSGFVKSAVFSSGNQSAFDEGVYSNTEYNGSGVVLSLGQVSGNYTSKVFDAGADSQWNNLSNISLIPKVNYLYGVDGGGGVYNSIDLGSTWNQKEDNYGRTSDTIEMFSDNLYLYILSTSNKEVWRSNNNGATWTVINNTFADSSLEVGEVKSNGNIFIADGSGDVYLSTDFAVSFIKKGDFNAGATNKGKGMGITSNGVIYIVDASGAVFSSSDSGATWLTKTAGYGGGVGTDDLEIDSLGNLYILNNKQIYKSSNQGATWNIINNSFTPYSGDGFRMLIDSQDRFFVIDGSGRIFKSTDFGVTWIEQGDMNAGAGNNPWGLAEFSQSTNLSFQVRNCSLSNCADASWQMVDLNNINLVGQYFQYKVDFSTPDSSVSPLLESVSLDYTILNTAPTISIVEPQNGNTYGYNESIALDFVATDAEDNIDSCWYDFDNGANISLPNCQNITFDTAEGSHTLTVYVNDSQNELASDSASFSVQVGAPTISLTSPIDSYLNSQNVVFRYTPNDIDLDYCELWGNFTGSYELNQTETSPVNGGENNFSLNLGDGAYLWNIKCVDDVGSFAFNGNQSFYVDTLAPSLTLTQPTGTKSSRTAIPLDFDVLDSSPLTCLYNIKTSIGGDVKANTSVINCTSTTFDLSNDGDFILNFYANDYAGNSNYSQTSFSVDTSGGTVVVGGGGGGGGSDEKIDFSGNLEVGSLQDFVALPRESKKMSLSSRNSGLTFLNNCKLNGKGDYAGWISSTENIKLGGGESYDFIFTLDVPEKINAGVYGIGIGVDCSEDSASVNFNVEVIEEKLNFELIEAKRGAGSNIDISYWLEESSGMDQDVEIQFLLFDENENKVAERTKTEFIPANAREIFQASIPIQDNLEGELSLLVNLNSETYSTFVKENFILGGPVGFAIFRGETFSDNLISGIIVVAFLIFAFVVVNRIMKYGKKRKSGDYSKKK